MVRVLTAGFLTEVRLFAVFLSCQCLNFRRITEAGEYELLAKTEGDDVTHKGEFALLPGPGRPVAPVAGKNPPAWIFSGSLSHSPEYYYRSLYDLHNPLQLAHLRSLFLHLCP